MFNKKLPEPPKKDIETILESSVEVKGNLKSDGNVKVDGKLVGEVKVSGHLIVGAPAEIKGNLTVGSAIVSGTIEGNVTAPRLLELTETGKVIGDLAIGKLKIAEGAIFTGNCKMEDLAKQEVSKPLSKEKNKEKPGLKAKPVTKLVTEKIKIDPGDKV